MGTDLLSSSSVMAPKGHSSHVMTTIFLLPSRTLLLSNPLRAHHRASLILKFAATALEACTSQSGGRVTVCARSSRHVLGRRQRCVPALELPGRVAHVAV